MNKKHVLFISMLMCATNAYAANSEDLARAECDDVASHSFFSIRPVYQTAMPEKETMFRDRIDARCDGLGGAFEIVGFGGRSTKQKDIGKYFSPCAKEELIVDSDNNNLNRDVNPFHFGIAYAGQNARFKSTIQFRPRQQFYGFGLTYRQFLHCRSACEKKWWLEISAPVIHVENNMKLSEVIDTAQTAGMPIVNSSANMVEAFKGEQDIFNSNEKFEFGKINGSRKKTGLGDIEIKIGYIGLDDCDFSTEGYVGIVIPTGNKPKAEYLFEPIIGDNKHAAVMLGTNIGYTVWENCDRTLHWEYSINTRYYFRNTQTRSFDLKDRRWSRYMLVYKDQDGATNNITSPGINVFTKKVRIDKRFAFNMNTGLVYDSCNFRGEVGVNFWARQAELIKLKDAWEEGPAIIALNDAAGSVDRLGNISEQCPVANNPIAYSQDTLIKAKDLDLCSAAAPGALTYTPYLSLGYHWDDWCYPTFIGFGASYEVSGRNTSINRWTAWGKFGFSI